MVLILHLLVIAAAVFFSYAGVRRNQRESSSFKLNFGYLTSFLILLCFLGFRVFLGRDWDNYERIFTSTFQQEFIFGESREIGFLLMVSSLRSIGADFQSFIFTSSFLILFLFYISYRKFYYLLPFGIFVFFMDLGYPSAINIIRQSVALMAFLNASLYIDSKEKYAFLKFLLFFFFGLLFHYSIIIMFPFYFLGKLKWKVHYYIVFCIAIFIVSLYLVVPMFEETLSLVDKYNAYEHKDTVNEESTFGLGAILVLLIRLMPIVAYEYVRKNNPEFLKYFVYYFVGLSISYGFYNFLLVTRITFYFQFFELFVQAFFIYYVIMKRKKFRPIGFGYMFIVLFNYIYTFNNFLEGHVAARRFSLLFMDFLFSGHMS